VFCVWRVLGGQEVIGWLERKRRCKRCGGGTSNSDKREKQEQGEVELVFLQVLTQNQICRNTSAQRVPTTWRSSHVVTLNPQSQVFPGAQLCTGHHPRCV